MSIENNDSSLIRSPSIPEDCEFKSSSESTIKRTTILETAINHLSNKKIIRSNTPSTISPIPVIPPPSSSSQNNNNNNNDQNHRGTIMRVLSRFSSTASADAAPVSHSRHSLLRMFSTRTTPQAPVSSTIGKRMLTCGQLSDLFRRLDKDGNGELDLEEFTQIISKLKINANEDFIARIFRKVDVAKSGTLDLQEFVSAYQMIFTRPSSFMGNNMPDKKGLVGKKISEFLCAIRYGIDLEGHTLYELYLGKVVDLPDGPLLLMDEKRVYKITNINEIADMEYEVVAGWTATLGDINELMVRDSMNNKMGKSKILWWLDVSMVKVASYRIDKYVAGFGLPNDSKFRSAFGQFGTCLPKEEKSHIYAGNGTSNLGGVSSLSFFVQALWIYNLPIVHHMPSWLDNIIENYCSQSIKNSIKNYYYSRFAFLISTSVSSHARHEEYSNTYDNAKLMADRLDDTRDDDDDEQFPNNTIGPIDKVSANILLPAPPLKHRQSKWRNDPTWLISGSDLKKRTPKLQFNDLSLHLLDQGHGPSALITIREIDNEKEAYGANQKKKLSSSLLEDSKCGIIGRILTGVRACILKNLCRDGIVAVAGELTDSSGALAAVIISLIQSFSMNTQGSLDTWLNLISAGVDDLAVSKHSAHAKELGNIIHLLRDYVEPTHEIFDSLYREGAKILADEALAEEHAAILAEEEALRAEEEKVFQRERLESIGSVGSSSSSSDENCSSSMSSSIQPITSSQRKLSALKVSTSGRKFSQLPAKKPVQRKSITLRRRTGITAEIQLSFATLSPGIQNVPINFSTIRGFFGTTACQNLGMILEGDESLEIKGTKYWSEQLGLLNTTFEKVKEDIRVRLEEKRNFFSFILTTVTVGLAPLTILTGYWGMNFENMWELDPDTYPDIPGVKLMWLTAFFVYCAFLIMSIHFRILYSAT
mmetsp:Transcript_13380/g.13877  ORF Transcript_13380/g.13877 Transcript_13380/m.13877 type:complete len:932 (-) Transcript_13380:194-2989(-)